jgi:hypothetical protein
MQSKQPISLSSLRSLRLCGAILLFLAATHASAGELRQLATPHYRIHTDLEQRLAEDMGTRMEAMYEQYMLRFGDFNPRKTNPFEVYLFGKRKDYLTLTDNRFPNTGGVFIVRRNLLAGFLEGQGRDGLRRTLQHEAFHQFAYTTIGPNMPVWLNEGIAQVFEEGVWAGQQFQIGQVPPRRLRQLERDLQQRRFMPFREFVAITDAQWGKDLGNETTAASRYDQAWAMTHFLIFAPDESGQPKYRARLTDMLRMLDSGTKGGDAFRASFSDNFDGFQERFMEYAKAMKPTPAATYIEYQAVLADMLVQLKDRGQRFDDIDTFRAHLTDARLRLRYNKGDVQWSTEQDPAVYFRDDKGRLMNRDQLYFSFRGGAPLPDIVCRPIDGMQFRTIFHDELEQRIDHETVIEPK